MRIFSFLFLKTYGKNNYNMGDTCNTHSAYEKSVNNLASEKLRGPGIKKNTIIIQDKVG